jgi:hypothetical protein
MSSAPRDIAFPEATRIGRNMQAAVYGTILTLSLIAVASEYQSSAPRIAASVLATQLIFYLAHVYAGQLGIRLETGRGLTSVQRRAVLREEWPLLAAAGPPCLVLIAGALAGINTTLVVNLALGVGVGTLALYGVQLGRAEHRSLSGVLTTAAVNSGFGLIIVVLKVAVH